MNSRGFEKVVYFVEHVISFEDIYKDEVVKFIGIFSTYEKAQLAVQQVSQLPEFNQFSLDCFLIEESKLDEYEWKEGFISWEEAMS